MLVLSRKTGESVVISGRIIVKIMRVEGDVVKLGIQAPAEVPVHRQEVYEEIQRNNQEALTRRRTAAPKLSGKTLSKSELEKPAATMPKCDDTDVSKFNQ
jgi:carbon storage regulator